MRAAFDERSDDLEAAIRAQLAAHGGRLPALSAQDLGLTMMAAARRYRKPLAVVRQVYRAAIGRCDQWAVWWAPQDEVQRVFSDPPMAEAARPVSVQRTFARRDRLRAKLKGQNP